VIENEEMRKEDRTRVRISPDEEITDLGVSPEI
jgi:hypothetical protein